MSAVRIMTLGALSAEQLGRLLRRRLWNADDVRETCRKTIDAVRRRGDDAVLEFTQRFDGVDLSECGLGVPQAALDGAGASLSPAVREALLRAIANISKLHEAQVPKTLNLVEVDTGLWCGDRWTPLDSVCLYVPRGRGAFSSVACMLSVPARLAGVERVIMCTPPGPEGCVDNATLFVAKELGIDEVYRIGGAQAVAAVAYGTETVPRCDKIVGPGNVYVSAARQLLAEIIDPGPPAGPSEALVICDESADPENAAWNLLIEAEHGENSCAVLVTHVPELAQAIATAAERFRDRLTEQRRRFADEVLSKRGGVLVTASLDESIAFANQFAAEHVALMVAEPWAVLSRIKHAGEILLGDFPIISLGNYAMGVNAILPTGGWARSSSGVSVLDFLKRTSVGYATKEAFEELSKFVPAISRDEGFSAHHEAILNWRDTSRENLAGSVR